MDYSLLLSFITASFLLAIMPGPDNILVMTESLTKNSKNGIALALGMNSGVLIHTLAAATGISIILQQSAIAYTIIKLMGATYLLYLAYKEYHAETVPLDLARAKINTTSNSYVELYKNGFIMNVLNPKVSLFFIALLPQFISKEGYSTMIQMCILGVIFMLIGAMVFSGIALLAGKLKKYISSQRFWDVMRWSKIVVLTLISTSLFLL